MVQQLRQIRIEIEPKGSKFDLTVHTSEEDTFYPRTSEQDVPRFVQQAVELVLSGLRTEGNDL